MYSPFSKGLRELDPDDLSVLTNTSEGWYVEYKRELPNANSIAKSISAFSNTYGGWLFYGVQEQSQGEPVAFSFPGISLTDLEPSLHRIRQAISTLVAPSPHFEARILHGPCPSIGLESERGIICIRIPRSEYAARS